MATFGRILVRAGMMLTMLLIVMGAYLSAKTPFQHVTVSLCIFLYCAIRYVGLSVIEQSELGMISAKHTPTTLVRLRNERRRSRIQANVECGFLTTLAMYAALKILVPSLQFPLT